MPITYNDINVPLSIKLDDQFSDRYRPDVRVGAMNTAVRRATAACGWAMANKKGPEEALRELTYLRIFQTDAQGGISLEDPALGHTVWNVLGIYARPITVQTASILPLPDDQSQYRDDLAFSGTGDRAERITLEEVPMRRLNIFLPGNEVLANNPNRVEFAYYIIGSAGGGDFQPAGSSLRVIPQSVTQKALIAMSYLAQPSQFFVDPNGNGVGTVEFPQSFLQTIVDWTANEISIPQGDGTTLYQTSKEDAAQLFNFIA